MATYKLIQDIEADDKLLGPLSFRQFVYAFIAVVMLYICFLLLKHHAAVLLFIPLPIACFTGFLAFPFGKDQPTEVWALAKLQFFIKPRRRIWAQSGVKELVTITVPKKIEIQRTDGLSQVEVQSRLQALANTIDSRGWAIKNINGVYQNPITSNTGSDRLISADSLPKDVPDDPVAASEDLFDEKSNPIAKQVGQMLNDNTAQRHQALLENLNAMRTENSQQPAPIQSIQTPAATIQTTAPPVPTVVGTVPVVQAATSPVAEDELDEKLKAAHLLSHTPLSNMHALRQKTAQEEVVSTEEKKAEPASSTAQNNPVIMNLSKRDDLNVNVLSNEVNRAMGNDSSGEVLISLH